MAVCAWPLSHNTANTTFSEDLQCIPDSRTAKLTNVRKSGLGMCLPPIIMNLLFLDLVAYFPQKSGIVSACLSADVASQLIASTFHSYTAITSRNLLDMGYVSPAWREETGGDTRVLLKHRIREGNTARLEDPEGYAGEEGIENSL